MSFDQELIQTFDSKTGLYFRVLDTDVGYSLIHADVQIHIEIDEDNQIIKRACGENADLINKIIAEIMDEPYGPYYHGSWEIYEFFEIT